ncbi:hypothetical protein M9H77_35512 [Catharanthus roseus]|uniref:Uncharacterized protein n=1 Tax=Catharanthus roseus TaxID=4058 RepID=A0ACB9ZP73_CATRO|nr:hypothetical protein M9H77_35512 [Catharanthus roseus]
MGVEFRKEMWEEEKCLDMQEHQGVVTRAKTKQLKSHKDQIEQEKFQGLNFNVQSFMGCAATNASNRNQSIPRSSLFSFTMRFFPAWNLLLKERNPVPFVFRGRGISSRNEEERVYV